MSFSFKVIMGRNDPIGVTIRNVWAKDTPIGPSPRSYQVITGTATEADTLVWSAILSVRDTLRSLGDSWEAVAVEIVGHVNPKMQAQVGWVNDFLSIRVSILEYAPILKDEEVTGVA